MIDFARLRLTPKPNQYLLAPPGLCAEAVAHRESPRFALSAPELAARFADSLRTEPRLEWAERSADGLAARLVQRSAVFRFPDDIDVRFLATPEGGSTLAIYARARYGTYDFGVNRHRIERWLARLSD